MMKYKVDDDLEKDLQTSANTCLTAFKARGGTLVEDTFKFLPGDAVYPICSGGVCRSQTVWAKLYPFREKIVLFPPHAARHGWDPYNGRLNRFRNIAQEKIPDDFAKHFKMERAQRFGFEYESTWAGLACCGQLDEISAYYDQHYFGPESNLRGLQGIRRVYVAFANNIHVTMHRLVQTNEDLAGVIVVAIDLEDIVTHPHESLNIVPRSCSAFAHLEGLLDSFFDCQSLRG